LQIGVLAIQGGFSKHEESLKAINIKPMEVRYESQLKDCDALIIPGGESTTISKLLKKYQLNDSIKHFAKEKPIMGTCAGLILMSKNSNDDRVDNLNIINAEVKRNGWGRQIESFSYRLKLKGIDKEIEAVFIRAPKIINLGSEVEVLAEINEEPVFIKQGIHFAATFHPELTNDTTIHEIFIESFAA
jgi:pyridoxal 5'-phosphate synthase pdxT subunit